MSNSSDYQLEFEEKVYLYHKGTKITFDDLESMPLKKLKSIAESVDLFVNLRGLSDLRAKQRIISALKDYIKNNLNPFLQYEGGDNDQKISKTKKKVTFIEFPCQKPNVKNFSMELEITFPNPTFPQ